MRSPIVALATTALVLASAMGVSADDGWERVSGQTLERLPFAHAKTYELLGNRLADGECGFRLSLTSTPDSPRVLGARIVATNRATCRAVVQQGEPLYDIFANSDVAESGVIAGEPGQRTRGKAAAGAVNAPRAHGSVSLLRQAIQEWDDNSTSAMRDRTINTLKWHYDGSCVLDVETWQVSWSRATVMTHDPAYDWGTNWSSCSRWTVEELSSFTKNTSPNFGCRDVNGYLYAYGWYNGNFTNEAYGSSGCPHFRVVYNAYV
jgi:hypothetical protein